MKASELIGHLQSYISFVGKDCEVLVFDKADISCDINETTSDGDFCVALTYLMSEKDSLNRFKVIGNKFDKKK